MAKCGYYKPYFDTLRKMIGEYYQLEGCASGGPLHILLDDDNYDINSVRWCLTQCYENLISPTANSMYSSTVYILGIMICNEYARLSLDERAAFDSYLNKDDLKCEGNCSSCRILCNECHKHMKEAEEGQPYDTIQ